MASLTAMLILLLLVAGAFCAEHEYIGKQPQRKWTQPSLDIINGNKTSVLKYPFIASLEHNGTVFGSGSVINDNWVLTTGWAVSGVPESLVSLRVGSSSFSKGGQFLKAKKIIIHPKYTGKSWDYDIALIKTDRPIKFGKKVQPIKMASQKLKGGTEAWIAGWGIYDSTGMPSKTLLEAQVTVLEWDKCKNVYHDDLTSRIMCTLDKTVSPAYADFAIPMVKDKILHGMFAGGYCPSPDKNPALYTDVSSLHKWVKSIVQNDQEE